jgi:hypothetical protein
MRPSRDPFGLSPWLHQRHRPWFFRKTYLFKQINLILAVQS